MAEAIEGFSQAANEKQVEIRLDLQNLRSSTLLTDPMRLQQILNNVIGNAVKFTESGRIEITVIESADADSSKFRFLIQDTGIGIDSEQTGRLFLPFSQADGSFARRFGGTGLGLLLSKRLAQRLGGDLWLETSEPGKGSLFIVEIQCQTVVTDSRCPEMSSPMPKIEPRTLRLLLVEDSRDNQMIVKAYMRSLPLHVDIANNGEEGLIMAKQAHYDLILLDIQMPILDGYETLAQMRAHGLHTPIIALTAHAMNTERERALAAGFQDFITKPIHRNVLLQKVQHYLQDPDLVADST